MISSTDSKRLLELFERDLRNSNRQRSLAIAAFRPKAMSGELERQVVEFAAQVRTSGSTPEQMLIDLKALLSAAAPEVPSSERSAFVSSITGWAIASFFGVPIPRPAERSVAESGTYEKKRERQT